MFCFGYHSSIGAHLADSMVENSIFQRKEFKLPKVRVRVVHELLSRLNLFRT